MGANNGEIWGGEKSRVTKVFDTATQGNMSPSEVYTGIGQKKPAI